MNDFVSEYDKYQPQNDRLNTDQPEVGMNGKYQDVEPMSDIDQIQMQQDRRLTRNDDMQMICQGVVDQCSGTREQCEADRNTCLSAFQEYSYGNNINDFCIRVDLLHSKLCVRGFKKKLLHKYFQRFSRKYPVALKYGCANEEILWSKCFTKLLSFSISNHLAIANAIRPCSVVLQDLFA